MRVLQACDIDEQVGPWERLCLVLNCSPCMLGQCCLSLPQRNPFSFHVGGMGFLPLTSENFVLATRDSFSVRVVLGAHAHHRALLKSEFQVRGGLGMTCMSVSLSWN